MPERRTAAVHPAAAVAQFQASHHIPRPVLLTCSVHFGWDGKDGHEEWGPQTSGSVTNTKHILPSSLEQFANLESSAPPKGTESKLPSSRFSCQTHAHLRLLSPSADTSVGLSGPKDSLGPSATATPQCTTASHPQAMWNGHVVATQYHVRSRWQLDKGVLGLARPTEADEGAGRGEASSRRSLFATK